MNFIKKVFDNKSLNDESVHLQFQKFSKGVFKDRAVINAKLSSGKYSISTTSEFANELVFNLAKKAVDKMLKVNGGVITTIDLEGKIDYSGKKQFMGVKQYIIDKEMTGKEIVDLIEKFPKAFFALSFNIDGNELKIKAKAPKSGKPSNKSEEKPVADFCKLKTEDKEIVRDFIFESNEFKIAEISHTFIIEDIIIPESLKKEKDFAIIREKAKRKGKIIRDAIIDGKNFKKEVSFEA